MFYHLGIYLFTAIFVLIQCQEAIAGTTEAPHNYTKLTNCHAHDIRRQINANKRNISVKLHNMHVLLKPEEGFEYDPSMVLVAQCAGHCRSPRAPMPTRSKKVNFIVHRYPTGQTDSSQCVNVEVDEHQMCRCMCKKNKDDCTSDQAWEEDICDCKCKPSFQTAKVECLAKSATMEWDPINCKCRCKVDIMECMSGLKFDKTSCSCVTPRSEPKRNN